MHGWLSWALPPVLVAAGLTIWLWPMLLAALAAAGLSRAWRGITGRRHG